MVTTIKFACGHSKIVARCGKRVIHIASPCAGCYDIPLLGRSHKAIIERAKRLPSGMGSVVEYLSGYSSVVELLAPT